MRRPAPATALAARGRELLDEHCGRVNRRVDRLLAGLIACEAVTASLRAGPGLTAGWVAVAGAVPATVGLCAWRAGTAGSRFAVAAAQVGVAVVAGRSTAAGAGPLVVASLVCLSFYRDWRVVAAAAAAGVAGCWPAGGEAGCVAVAGGFLSGACVLGRREATEIAARRAADEAAAAVARVDRDDLLTALNAGVVMGMTDADGRITYANDQFCATSGYAREHLLGRPLPELVDPEQMPARFWDEVRGKVAAGGVWQGEVCNRSRDGRPYWVAATIKGLLGPDRRLRRIVTVQSDITEQKGAELHRAQAQRLESIGQLAAGIAHEINTPTQYVGDNVRFAQDGFAAMVKALDRYDALLADESPRPWRDRRADAEAVRKELDLDFMRAEVPQAIAQSLEGLERVALIVGAMKDFSHPGSTTKEPADLNRAILSTVEVCRNRWKYVADVLYELSPGLPPVPCLVAEFNQVVLNLIVNAADAIEQANAAAGDAAAPGAAAGEGTAPARKGKIRLGSRVTDDGRAVEVTVADNGPGIPAAVQAKMFEPFFTTKPVGKGTGQGLTLSRNVIVKKHGGQLGFRSTAGHGTTFTIRLPLTAAGDDGETPAAGDEAPPAAGDEAPPAADAVPLARAA